MLGGRDDEVGERVARKRQARRRVNPQTGQVARPASASMTRKLVHPLVLQ